METAESHRRHRLVLIALSALGVAFAWLVLSLFGGIGASDARADDSDGSGLLGGVTSLVDEVAEVATSAATQTVSAVVAPAVATVVEPASAPVVEMVQPVVEHVATPVAQAVAPVVSPVAAPVTTVVAPVVSAVETVVADASIEAVTAPVVELVTAVPVVGGVVTALGVDTAVTDTSATLDRTVDVLTGVLPAVGPVLTTPPSIGGTPGSGPMLDGYGPLFASPFTSTPTAATIIVLATAPSTDAFGALSAMLRGSVSDSVVAVSPAAFIAPPGGSESSAPLVFPGPCGAGGMSSAGSGSSGSSGAALLAFGPLLVHRAWVRRRATRNDQVPPAPAASTDVSPD